MVPGTAIGNSITDGIAGSGGEGSAIPGCKTATGGGRGEAGRSVKFDAVPGEGVSEFDLHVVVGLHLHLTWTLILQLYCLSAGSAGAWEEVTGQGEAREKEKKGKQTEKQRNLIPDRGIDY